jgi:hypothetical protein
MLASTLLAIPFVPVFFIVLRRLGVGVPATARPAEVAAAPPR